MSRVRAQCGTRLRAQSVTRVRAQGVTRLRAEWNQAQGSVCDQGQGSEWGRWQHSVCHEVRAQPGLGGSTLGCRPRGICSAPLAQSSALPLPRPLLPAFSE